jgi:hypothetical protein
MTANLKETKPVHRKYPKVDKLEDGRFQVNCASEAEIMDLLGMKTETAADGVYKTTLNALGKQAEEHNNVASAMFAELEPRDGVEAILVGQMTATHVAMTTLMHQMTCASYMELRESYERSVTRLSRTYLAQVETSKKYRAKAQQTVRVERVNVESGGQAIVGDVSTGGRANREK